MGIYSIVVECFFVHLQSDLNVVAAFDRRGEYIYTGNAKGKVSAFLALKYLALKVFTCFSSETEDITF